jgi:hypothetical protein
MLKGLRKRPSYDELINEVDAPFITQYPNRKASEIENSVYMSQLRAGFEEVIEQNNRVLKEKTKEVLLQEEASSGDFSHASLRAASSRYSSAPESEADEMHTPRSEPEASTGLLSNIPLGPIDTFVQTLERQEQAFREEAMMVRHHRQEETRLQRQRRYDTLMSIGTQIREGAGSIVPRVGNVVERLMNTRIIRSGPSPSTNIPPLRLDLALLEDPDLHDLPPLEDIPGFLPDPEPEQAIPKAKAQAAPKQATRPDPELEHPIPKAKAKGRPKKSDEPNPEPEDTRATKSFNKKIIKKDKPKHETEIKYLALDELYKKNKGFLVDQIHKRPGLKFNKSDAKTKTIKQMAELIYRFDHLR